MFLAGNRGWAGEQELFSPFRSPEFVINDDTEDAVLRESVSMRAAPMVTKQ